MAEPDPSEVSTVHLGPRNRWRRVCWLCVLLFIAVLAAAAAVALEVASRG